MAMSKEYPDLKWVEPASWTNANRSSVQLIVIHTTEGSAHSQSAEDGAAYDARRTDGTSTHFFHDSDSTVQCVHTADKAHTARTQGNSRGVQHELCGTASWSESTWLSDGYQDKMLRKAAKQCARDAQKWGIPVKHLTISEIQSGKKGFCGHGDITKAFPEDNGTHTDPGKNFPWSKFLDLVRAEMGGLPMDQGDFNKLMDGWAGTANGKKALELAAHCDSVQRYGAGGEPVPDTDPNPKMGVDSGIGYLGKDSVLLKEKTEDIHGKVGDLDQQLHAQQEQLDRIEAIVLDIRGDIEVPEDGR